jgi:hypothetical protein
LYLLIHVFLEAIEAQLWFVTEATGYILTTPICPWGPSATRELIEVTTRISPPVHGRHDATSRLPTLFSLTHELVHWFVSSARFVILWKAQTLSSIHLQAPNRTSTTRPLLEQSTPDVAKLWLASRAQHFRIVLPLR